MGYIRVLGATRQELVFELGGKEWVRQIVWRCQTP